MPEDRNGSLYAQMGLTKAEIVQAGKKQGEPNLQKRIWDNLVTMDSYLSLLYHRHVEINALDSQARYDIEDAISECRKLQAELGTPPTETPPSKQD